MSVSRDADGRILLTDACPVEDAEPLLQLLQETPDAACDWSRCSHVHTAVIQVILAVGPTLIGPCGDSWIEQWVASQLRSPAA